MTPLLSPKPAPPYPEPLPALDAPENPVRIGPMPLPAVTRPVR